MTRLRRKLFVHTLLLGAALTLTVIVLDAVSVLAPLENWFYDQRALHCQQFAPAPTTQLVHLDVDDRAMEVLGKWPWPRSTLAIILDELARARPKAVATDIIFSEAEVPSDDSPEAAARAAAHDAALAAALRRLDCAIVPAALFNGRAIATPLARAMLEEFKHDLALSEDQIVVRLRQRGFPQPRLPSDVAAIYYAVRREAAFSQVYALLAATGPTSTAPAVTQPADAVRAVLRVPTEDLNYSSPLTSIVRQEFAHASAIIALRRFAAPLAETGDARATSTPIKLASGGFLAPLAIFTDAARGTGYVDFFSDGVVRNVPLLAAHDGRVYPQLGVALALKCLDVDLRSVRFTPSVITIPAKSGTTTSDGGAGTPSADIAIPVRTTTLGAVEGGNPLVMDIPWFGTRDWETMYDVPSHARALQHIGILKLWQAHQTEQKLLRDTDEVDRSLLVILSTVHKDQAWKYEEHPPAPEDVDARMAMVHRILADPDVKDQLEQLLGYKPEELDEQSRRFIASYNALRVIPSQLGRLLDQLSTVRGQLSGDFGGKAVLIGWTATGAAADFVPTPLHAKCPGVVVHGAVFNAIMTDHFWRQAPQVVTYLITLLLGVLTAFVAVWLSAPRGLACSVLLLVGYLCINGLVLFGKFGLLVGVAAPVLAVLFVWAMCTLYRIIVETRERELIKARFRQYVDPMLLNFVLEHPEKASFAGEVKELTVVFTDLANFTSLSERLGERSVTLLNEYLSHMVPIIRRHDGYLNKFLGDGIMCFYGAPFDSHTHAADAVRTALDMQAAMVSFNEKLGAEGFPPLTVRAGISTGEMIVGDAGAGQEGSDYTVLGDAVNFGARLEGANKYLDTRVLVSRRTAECAKDEFLFRPVGRYRVVGKTEGVDVYEAIAPLERATERQKQTAALTRTMVEAFSEGRFEACLDAVAALNEHLGGSTKLTKQYQELAQKYLREPPPEAGWDGTISLTEK